MEVILKEDVPNVGRVGELVSVSGGYARNFLLPRALAVVANRSNQRIFEHHKRVVEANKKKIRESSETRADEMKAVSITLKKRFNESGKMFGGITGHELSELLKSEKGISLDRRDFEFPDIKEVGSYKVKVRLPGDVFSEIELKVEAEKAAKIKMSSKRARYEEEEQAGEAEDARRAKARAQKEAKAAEDQEGDESVETPEAETSSEDSLVAEESNTDEPKTEV